jgi:MFS transporter, ACS family, hexuronate transporter
LLTSVSVFALSLTTSGYWALILDLVPHDKVGGAGGFCLGVGSTAGILAPAITGMIVSTYQSFVGAFAITGTVAAAGAVALLFLVRHRDTQMATV